MENKINRRQALGLIATATAAGLVTACTKEEKKTADTVAKTETPAAGGNYVSETDTVAKTLGYKEDASAVPADVRIDKGNTKGADQLCSNCQFYKGTEAGGGTCSLFPGKLVKEKGWCKSWSLAAQ